MQNKTQETRRTQEQPLIHSQASYHQQMQIIDEEVIKIQMINTKENLLDERENGSKAQQCSSEDFLLVSLMYKTTILLLNKRSVEWSVGVKTSCLRRDL